MRFAKRQQILRMFKFLVTLVGELRSLTASFDRVIVWSTTCMPSCIICCGDNVDIDDSELL